MDWKNKIDECCADELEEMIVDYVRAGFLSDDEIAEECEEYIEENYPDDCGNLTDGEIAGIIEEARGQYQSDGNQETFSRLDTAFCRLNERGVIALHCAGYTQSEGFEDCNEIATQQYEDGGNVIGCCFYTMQDLEHLLHEESALLYLSFGNYFDHPTAEEIGRLVVDELARAGFATEWNEIAQMKIGIRNIR